MRSSLSVWLCLFSCLARCAGQESGSGTVLAPGHPVSVLLTPEHPSTLRLDLSRSHAEEIVLDAAVPDIGYQIATGDGSEILSGRLTTFGWASIPMSAAGRGEAQIRLESERKPEGLPGVRVRVELRSIPSRTLAAHRRAAQLFNAAQTLHRSLRAENLRRAIWQFEQAAQLWVLAGDTCDSAMALGAKDESEVGLSLYGDARRTLNRALALAGKCLYLRGWLLHLEARMLLDQWQGALARPYAEEELRLGEEIGDPALIALARTDLVGVAYWFRDEKMGELASQAHDEAVAAGVPDTLAIERRWKAWVDEYYERRQLGMRESSESEAYFRQAGDLRNALDASIEVAEAVSLDGDFYSALATFSKLNPVVRDSGSALELGTNLVNIGIQHQQLNDLKLANTYFRRADAVYASAHILFGRMLSHQFLCRTDRSAHAVPECKLSLSFARQFGDAGFTGQALCDLGIAERKEGSLTEAFADLTEAAKITHTIHDLRFESKEHIQLGELLEQQGKGNEAFAEFEQAESLSHGVADPTSLLDAQYAVARWYARDGQYDKADAKLTSALEKLEAARQLVNDNTLQASYFAAGRKCYELAVELRMGQFEREPTEGADALALEMSERGRARGLLDALSVRAATGRRGSGKAEVDLMRAKLAVDRAFDHRLKLLVENSAKLGLEANSGELTQALADLERAEDDASVDASQATKPASTIPAAEIERASLVSGATFFEYALGDQRSFLWVIGAGKRKTYVLPPRRQLEDMVTQWRSLVTSQDHGAPDARAKFQHLSRKISCALLADAVKRSMTKMIIVPDGGLAMLPFGALPESGCSSPSAEPLVSGHEITLTPSLSVFLSPKPKAEKDSFQGEVAIVADPVFDAADPRAAASTIEATKKDSHPVRYPETAAALPRLLNAGYEARAIQETVGKAAGKDSVFLAQGFDASVDTVLGPAMRDYRIWHLATHGVYDENMPEFSGLVFSLLGRDGRPRFGFLKAHDIAQLNVTAELVVLSACDSAAGQNVNGEGVMGLSYAFLRAGAKQVVSTLWSIDDAKSRELMIAFYKELMRNGKNAAAALRQSQLTLMRQSHNSSPYYWAGFELTSVGD